MKTYRTAVQSRGRRTQTVSCHIVRRLGKYDVATTVFTQLSACNKRTVENRAYAALPKMSINRLVHSDRKHAFEARKRLRTAYNHFLITVKFCCRRPPRQSVRRRRFATTCSSRTPSRLLARRLTSALQATGGKTRAQIHHQSHREDIGAALK